MCAALAWYLTGTHTGVVLVVVCCSYPATLVLSIHPSLSANAANACERRKTKSRQQLRVETFRPRPSKQVNLKDENIDSCQKGYEGYYLERNSSSALDIVSPAT